MKMTQVLADDDGIEVMLLQYDPARIPAGVAGALGILNSSLCAAARTDLELANGRDRWDDVSPGLLDELHRASPGTHEVLSIELDRGAPAEPDPPPRNGHRAAYGDGEREPCPLGCGGSYRPGNGLSNHVNNKCPKRTLDVDDPEPEPEPESRATPKAAAAERIECPNGCGKKTSPGRLMESHLDRCRLRVP